MVKTGCAVNCRYCFRQNFDYAAFTPEFYKEVESFFTNKSDIHEVILSGGDPLILSDKKIEKLLDILQSIHSIKTIRIHSRVPIVLPSRITENFIHLFDDSRFRLVMVIHSNHEQEFDDTVVVQGFQRLSNKFQLLNQSVLLKNINDSAEILTKLSHQLHQLKVLPYYLHHLDPVQGSARYMVSIKDGKKIIKEMQAVLPGYLVPRYVIEKPGEASKTLL
jgi:KamA family protein